MVHLQVRTHMGELEQPNQLYLKEVGSLNVGAPAHLSMRARVPPYPARVDILMMKTHLMRLYQLPLCCKS